MVKKAPHMVKMTPPPKKKKKNVAKRPLIQQKKMFLIFQGGPPPADVHVQASNLNQKIKVISTCLLELW